MSTIIPAIIRTVGRCQDIILGRKVNGKTLGDVGENDVGIDGALVGSY